MNTFRDALVLSIRKTIREVRSQGTVGMSVDNLMMIVRPPSRELDGAPRGTNARYYYAQLFREVCRVGDISAFVRECELTP